MLDTKRRSWCVITRIAFALFTAARHSFARCGYTKMPQPFTREGCCSSGNSNTTDHHGQPGDMVQLFAKVLDQIPTIRK